MEKNNPYLGSLWNTALTFCVIGAVTGLSCVWVLSYVGFDGWFYYRAWWDALGGIAHLSLIALFFGGLIGALLGASVALLCNILPKAYASRVILWAKYAFIWGATLVLYTVLLNSLLNWFAFVGWWIVPAGWRNGLWLAGLLGLVSFFIREKLRSDGATIFEDFFSSGITRRNVLLAGSAAGSVAIASAIASARDDDAVSPADTLAPGTKAAPDILLVTFDALNAEDMSSYGYHLPTTPNIDRLAQSSTVFEQIYSCSTFTTPCVVAFSTGRYPSSTHVFHQFGRLYGQDCSKTLAHSLKQAGYETGAVVANHAAHPLICNLAGYDIAPSPPINVSAIRSFFEAGYPEGSVEFNSVFESYRDVRNHLAQLLSRPKPAPKVVQASVKALAPPTDCFFLAKKVWRELKGKKFLHVHLFVPHGPYQPSAAFHGRFLEANALRDYGDGIDVASLCNLRTLEYPPHLQPVFDKVRLRYDEWICEADAAFGAFLDELRKAGELDNTIIAFSSDHGESFQGGMFSHGTGKQLRANIHVPLIIHMPGETVGTRVSHVADATCLAPTLLDLAGLSVPKWMDGRSLRPNITQPENGVKGHAFTQYFERNSAFRSITNGTIGIIDGQHQYIVDVETGGKQLYALSDAHLHSENLAASQPYIAQALHERIRSQFPNIAIPA